MKQIRLGTRGSKLALAQAELVKNLIEERCRDVSVILRPMRTTADSLNEDYSAGGGKLMFTDTIEEALLQGKLDIAVHSMKDLATVLPPGLIIAGTPQRGDVRDVLVTRKGQKLEDLPTGARIGTCSLRRKCQLLELRRDINVVDIRGNVDTRLRKLHEGQVDALILSACGLQRLGLDDAISQFFTIDQIIPAACQAVLAIETRVDDEFSIDIAKEVTDVSTFNAASCERDFLQAVGGDCNKAVAANASLKQGRIRFLGLLGYDKIARYELESNEDGHIVAKKVAANLLARIQDINRG